MERMNTLTVNTDTLSVNETTAPRAIRRRAQSIRSLEQLAEAETLLDNVMSNDELLAGLAARGFDAAAFATGRALCATVQEAFVSRQQALGMRRQAQAALTTAMQTAHADYVEFRASARALFPSKADRTLLDLDAPIPYDAYVFLSLARVVYQTAGNTVALANEFAGYGYTAERLAELQLHLTAVADAQSALDVAQANARLALLQRGTAINSLNHWLLRLTTALRHVTNKRPDLQTLVGV